MEHYYAPPSPPLTPPLPPLHRLFFVSIVPTTKFHQGKRVGFGAIKILRTKYL